MDEKLQSLILAEDAETFLAMNRQGAFANIPQADKEELPRFAARHGKADMLRLIMTYCSAPAIDVTDTKGRTLLHEAASSGDPETVRFVMEVLGYDPTQADEDGITAMDLALQKGTPEALRLMEAKAGFALSESYRNPVVRGFAPDPSIVRVGDAYYMVNSSFVQFPCLPVSRSEDLVHWQVIGHAVERLEGSGIEGLPGGYGYWAPDISYDGRQFWVVATLRRDAPPFRLQMLTHAERPEGPWSEPVALEIDGIDPSLFTDADGRRYVVTNPGACITEIDEEGHLLSRPEMIYYGSGKHKSEGPHLLRKDGWYYLFQAEGGTGFTHTETVARSRQLWGPYEPCPFNPILGRVLEHPHIGRSGHGKPFTTPDGRWYMVYLCGRSTQGLTILGRETALDPITWTADGWPMVNHLCGPSSVQALPLPGMKEKAIVPDVCAPRSDPATFTQQLPDGLRLRAGADPSGLAPVSMVLHHQRELSFRQRVTVHVSGLAEGSDAGITNYYDERSFLLFGVKRTAAGGQLYLRQQIDRESTERILGTVTGEACTLTVEGRERHRTLCWEDGTCALDAAYLSDEGVKGGKRYTGACVGLYAIGGGSADFTDYTEDMWEEEEP